MSDCWARHAASIVFSMSAQRTAVRVAAGRGPGPGWERGGTLASAATGCRGGAGDGLEQAVRPGLASSASAATTLRALTRGPAGSRSRAAALPHEQLPGVLASHRLYLL